MKEAGLGVCVGGLHKGKRAQGLQGGGSSAFSDLGGILGGFGVLDVRV